MVFQTPLIFFEKFNTNFPRRNATDIAEKLKSLQKRYCTMPYGVAVPHGHLRSRTLRSTVHSVNGPLGPTYTVVGYWLDCRSSQTVTVHMSTPKP